MEKIPANKLEERVFFFGRHYYDREEDGVFFSFSATGFCVRFRGTCLLADLSATGIGQSMGQPYLGILLEGELFENARKIKPSSKRGKVILLSGLEDKEHVARVYKLTESHCNLLGLHSLSTDGTFLPASHKAKLLLETYGDSISCGDGIEGVEGDDCFETRTENALLTYTAVASEKLDADFSIQAVGGFGLTVTPWNQESPIRTTPPLFSLATYNDKTSEENKVPYDNSASRKPDYVIVNLGTNDAEYYEQLHEEEQEEAEKGFPVAYKEFTDRIFSFYPECRIIMGIGMIPSPRAVGLVEEAYRYIHNPRVYFLPFDSFKVGGYCADNGHPNKNMHKEAGLELFHLIQKIEEEKSK